MAKREVHDCDGCGAAEIAPIQVTATTDRRATAAGDMEDDWETVDLCPRCAGGALRAFVQALTHEQARNWLARVRRKGARR